MKQQAFTNYVILSLIKEFPQFIDCVTYYTDDGTACIRYKSRAGKLILWIATTDKEITVGFGSDYEYMIWHTHMSSHGATTPYEELEEATKLIRAILYDVEPILYMDSEEGYYLTSDIEAELKEFPEAEVYKWSEL